MDDIITFLGLCQCRRWMDRTSTTRAAPCASSTPSWAALMSSTTMTRVVTTPTRRCPLAIIAWKPSPCPVDIFPPLKTHFFFTLYLFCYLLYLIKNICLKKIKNSSSNVTLSQTDLKKKLLKTQTFYIGAINITHMTFHAFYRKQRFFFPKYVFNCYTLRVDSRSPR